MRHLKVVFLCLLASVWLATPACAQSGPPRFLVISDIHFDPFADPQLFDALRRSPAELWESIFEAGAGTGFSQKGSDSNYALLKSSLDSARERIPKPDFVLYGGDFLAHGWRARYDALAPESHLDDPAAFESFTNKTLRFLAQMFAQRFPDTLVFPTLGNADAYCGDYQLVPDGEFLKQFAEAWRPLITSPGREGWEEKSLVRGGYYSIPLSAMQSTRLVVLNSVFFSVRYTNPCGRSDQTPGLNQLRWLKQTLETASLNGEKVWLLMHMPPGINSFSTEKSLESGGAPVSFWQRELTAGFVRLAAQHRERLRIGFAGHTHMDDYRVIWLDRQPLLLSKIVPSISPIFGNNPGYQIYSFERSTTLQPLALDFETIGLANLATGQAGSRDTGDWRHEYDFVDAYGFGSLSAVAVTRLANALAVDGSTRADYTRFYPVSADPQFDDSTIDIYRCAILNLTAGEFGECYSLEPSALSH